VDLFGNQINIVTNLHCSCQNRRVSLFYLFFPISCIRPTVPAV